MFLLTTQELVSIYLQLYKGSFSSRFAHIFSLLP